MAEQAAMRQQRTDTVQRMEYRVLHEAHPRPAFPGLEPPLPPPEPEVVLPVDESPLLRERVRELETQLNEVRRQSAAQLADLRREAEEQARRRSEDERRQSERWTSRLNSALAAFTAEREDYFTRVEQEVVRLALAIAARILHRESQLDPLLLSGAVRVALNQLAESTAVRIRVPAAELELWQEMLRLMPGLPLRPQVVGDAALSAEDCILETDLGAVDLGVRAQLVEIERGFFDLLESRPQVQAQDAAPVRG